MHIFRYIVIFFCSTGLFALDLCALRLSIVATDYKSLSAHSKDLKKQVYNDLLHPQSLKAEEVQSLELALSEGLGLVNKGFYRVELGGEKYLLKIRSDEKEFLEGNQLHEVLGQVGLAPELKGTLSSKEMEKLSAKYPQLKFKDEVTGLVMKEISDVWNPKNTTFAQSPLPTWVKNLNSSAIRSQLDHLKKILVALKVDPQDLQVFITKDSHVILGDLDKYKVKDERSSPNYLENMDYFFSDLYSDIHTYINF